MPHRPLLSTIVPLRHLTRTTTTAAATTTITTTDPAILLRLCTILYQHQRSPYPKVHSRLLSLHLPSPLPHHLFFDVASRFPLSWRPLHLLHVFATSSSPLFSHSPSTSSRLLDVFAKSRNVSLLWDFLHHIAAAQLLTLRAILIAARHLAEARDITKCVQLFHLAGSHNPSLYTVGTLNRVVCVLASRKLVDVALAVVSKARSLVGPPDEETYRYLVVGFCKCGDLVTASKVWNRMVDEGLEPDAESYEEIMVTLFKNNRFEDAIEMFKIVRSRRYCDMGVESYRIVISWVCKEGRVLHAYMLFAEMVKRGLGVGDATLGDLVYGSLARRRVREGYKVLEGVQNPDIGLYHGLIKGLLRLRRAAEATEVFREMIRRGVEPIMHTYIMLLQGHLGKRGRKARDPAVNFESIFVGGLVKAGRMLEATKFVERTVWGGVEVPRFDYNQFLYCFSNEEGVVMFEEVGRRLREAGLVDLGDIFLRYGEKMATRDRRRRVRVEF